MNKSLAKLPAMLLLAAAACLPSATLFAADAKPALTVAFAGYDQLVADVKVIDKIDAKFGLADKLEGLLQQAFGLGRRCLGLCRQLGHGDSTLQRAAYQRNVLCHRRTRRHNL